MSVSMLSQQPRLRALLHFSTFSLVLSLQPPCGHNWISSHQSGSCIWFYNDQLNYHDARQSCQSKGGDLLKILDSSMNDFLFSAFRLGNGGVYIGLSNIYGGYFYTWLGSIAEVNLFGSSMFNPPKSGTFCVQLNINSTHKKGWKAIGCDKTGSYICEKYPVKLCDPGWIPSPHSGTCIKLYSNEMRWDFARTACQRKGADLAMIFNEAQTSFISEQRRHHSDVKKYWIGLKRPSNGASYRWLDYADKVVFTQWANNTSIPSTGYPCVALIEDIVWSSFSCHEIAGYVCEKFSDCRYRQYGMLCPADCSTTHCKGKARACNPRSGVCTHGCEIGYSGPTCILGSCPTGWTLSPHSGTCLAFAYTKTDWISAKKGCREDNGDLVIITDDSMNQFIWDQISPYASAPYWIGLNDRAVEGKFQWMDYIEQVTYTNWDVSEPKNRLGTEDCASINSFGAKTMKWSSDNCDMKANFICETYADCKKKSFGMVCPKTCSLYCMNQDCNRRTGSCSFGCKFGYGGSNCNISLCPIGWTPVASFATCIKKFTSTKSWLDARVQCQSFDADLVSIMNVDMYRYLTDQKSIYDERYWIGLSDRKKEGKFAWLDSEDEADFTSPFDKQSNNVDDQDCVLIEPSSDDWKNVLCTTQQQFICEWFLACVRGTYGRNCSRNCSAHCAGPGSMCDGKYGHCLIGCISGYQPPVCEKACGNGTYGQACSQHCRPGCENNCHHVHGTCDWGCSHGYIGVSCNEKCSNGTYGENCSQTCSLYCQGADHACDFRNGTCLFGCDSGYQGPRCNTPTVEDNSIGLYLLIAVLCLSPLFLCCMGLATFIEEKKEINTYDENAEEKLRRKNTDSSTEPKARSDYTSGISSITSTSSSSTFA